MSEAVNDDLLLGILFAPFRVMIGQIEPQKVGKPRQRKLDAVARALLTFIVFLSIIWALAASSLVQTALQQAKQMVVAVPTPLKIELSNSVWSFEDHPQLPLMSEEEKLSELKAADVLDDPLDRIGEDFRVPDGLRRRTQFWLNIYTQYGRYDHVIHHTRYPWIIYKVILGEKVIDSAKGPQWMRQQKLEKIVAAERIKIRDALRRLSKRTHFAKLTGLEKQLYRQLQSLKGNRRYVFLSAAKNLRSQLGQKDFFAAGLKRSSKYLPYMEKKFAELGLPTELTRIPFVESSFNEKAESKVGASGVWQIMPSTGKAYLKVGQFIDERNSPMKATEVAAALLRQNHRALKSWPLAVTAYNNGLGNIRQALKEAGSQDIGAVISRYHKKSFKFASANFYSSFMAALHAERYQEIFFDPYQKTPLDEIEEIQLTEKIRARSLVEKSGLSQTEFLSLNLDIKKAVQKNTFLPKGLRVLLPAEKAFELKKLLTESAKRDRNEV